MLKSEIKKIIVGKNLIGLISNFWFFENQTGSDFKVKKLSGMERIRIFLKKKSDRSGFGFLIFEKFPERSGFGFLVFEKYPERSGFEF